MSVFLALSIKSKVELDQFNSEVVKCSLIFLSLVEETLSIIKFIQIIFSRKRKTLPQVSVRIGDIILNYQNLFYYVKKKKKKNRKFHYEISECAI